MVSSKEKVTAKVVDYNIEQMCNFKFLGVTLSEKRKNRRSSQGKNKCSVTRMVGTYQCDI